jgi:secondary thiamine-phosphate synthase enzyme
MRQIKVKTKKLREVINITPQVEKMLEKYPARDGMIHLYLRHTTAALTTAFIGEDVDLGMLGAFEMMLPHQALADMHAGIGMHNYEHTHHTSHLPAHVVASMLGPHLAIPVEDNKLKLGTFQSIALVELNGPLEREIIVDYQEVK